jgi:sugar phosphate permease
MYIAYMMSVFNSVSFEVSMPAVVDSDLDIDSQDFGFAIAVGQVATVTGKIFCGFVVDKRGASAAFYEALLLMGVVTFLGVVCMQIGLRSGALACFFLLKLAKSAVWPAMAKAAKAAFDSAIFGRVWGVLVTSSRVGAVCGAVILSPFVMIGWAWPALIVGAGLVTTAGILRLFIRHDAEQTTGLMSPAGKAPTISMREALRLYGKDTGLWLIVASEGMLLTVMETGTLVPLYMHSRLGVELDEAARFYSLFPLGMVIFTAAGGFMYDALPPARRADMLLLLGLSSATSYVLLASASSPRIAGLLLFCAGGCFAPAKYLPPTIYTLEHVDSQHSGKVIALMDVPGYCER